MKKSRLLIATSLATTLVLTAAPAWAQAAPKAAPEAAGDEAAGDEIIVTGSLISNPNLERSSPVNVTTAAEIELRQSNVAEEVLREIPGIVPNIGSAVNNGNGGASYVDLRGLGSNRNIVLLDGVRIAPSNTVGRVDLNNIPLALVERVDSLTGAASTTYGADAVSGVVNFITKRNFAGFEAALSEQVNEKGDGNTFRADVTLGANFDDGRGNAVFSIGYQQADPVYQGGRPFSANQLDSFSGLPGGSSTTVPAVFSFAGGGIGAARLTGSRQLDTALNAVRTQRNAAGAVIPGDVPVYAPFNFNPFNIFQTPFKRFNIFGAARYEISDAVEAYTRGLFSKNTVDTIVAPSGVFASLVTIPVSNPYLPVALRNQFCNNQDFDLVTPGIQTLTAAQCTAAAAAISPNDPNYRTFQTSLRRRTPETGSRVSDYSTTIFDYQAGFRGAITDKIKWDVSGSYGESENRQTLQGYVLTSRVRDALLATNTTTCLSGTAGCVPLNIFGPSGSITAAQIPYITAESTTLNKTSLAQVHGTISGESGFASPFASDQVSFAIGGEYRKYKASQRADLLAQTPGELGGAGGAAPNIDGGYDVYEGFGELIAPLVQDKQFFKNLTLEAGVRYSSYSVAAPTSPSYKTTTYKFGGSWEPVGGIKVRGNYSHAVRAPNINELFAPNVTGLTNLSNDPCAGAAPIANANLRAVCLAQGAPVGLIGSIAQPAAGQANETSGGNLALRPETANTYTIGTVLQPEFVPGLSLTIDYYNIKVSGAVTTPTPGDAIAACFGNITAGSATNPACTSIGRNPTTGALDGDPATTTGLFLGLSNQGKLATDGIDLALNYKRDIGFADLTFNFIGNYTFNSKFKSNQADPASLNRECVGFYSVNCGSLQPKFQWSQRTTLTFGDIDLSLLWRHIDSFRQEPDDVANGNGPAAPGFGTIKAFNYFDLASRFGIGDHMTLTLSVANLFDKKPPIVGTGIASTTYNSGNTFPSTYDTLGRRFAVGAKIKF